MDQGISSPHISSPTTPPALHRRFNPQPLLSTLSFSFLDLALVLLVLAIVLITPTDPDLWWHLKVGQDALDGTFPFKDVYTWSMPGYAWVDHEWLTDMVMALIYQASGLTGLGVIFGGIIGGAYLIAARTGAMINRSTAQGEALSGAAGWRLALALAAVAMLVNSSILGPRAQMITLAGFALINDLIWRFMLGNRRSLWCLPLIFGLWANLHGGFVIGLAQVGLTLALLIVAQWLPFIQQAFPFAGMQGAEVKRRIRHLALICVSCFAATLINPYTYRLYEEAARTSLDQFARAHIVEWMSVNFQQPSGLLVGMFCSIFVWWLLWTRKYHSAWHMLLLPIYLYMGMSSIRHAGLLVIFTLPWVYAAAASVPAVEQFFQRGVDRLFGIRRGNGLYYTYNVALVIVALVTLAMRAQGFVSTSTDPVKYAQSEKFPREAVQYLKTYAQADDVLWNDYAWGGYLIWHLPEHKVYIDGRMASWRSDNKHILKEYIAVSRLGPNWMQVLTENRVTLILTGKASSLSNTLRQVPTFASVYEDDLAVLFRVKKEAK